VRIRLSRRVSALSPSSTGVVAKAARTLAASGVDVVDFGLGEPDFSTPEFVARAGIAAIESGHTKYTDTAGDAALRDAIVQKYRREHGVTLVRENVLVTAGAKQAVFNACQALFEEGDEVAIFSPYWVSFPDIVRLAGATPLVVSTDLSSGWKPTAAALARVAGDRTRGVILNSPNNPTGTVAETEEIERILGWCRTHRAVLIFDETYDRFLYDGRPHVSASRYLPVDGAHLVVAGAASKTYAMTGWRLGWAVGSKELVAGMASYQSHSTSNASSIAQEAVRVALSEVERSNASVSEMLAQYTRRREAMVRGLTAIEGVRCRMPEGAFYAFADVSALYGPRGARGSSEFCRGLLEEAHVAAVPGDAFGNDSCVRFSFAASLERIAEGLKRIAAWAK
jgi:aspartate aminotransferase